MAEWGGSDRSATPDDTADPVRRSGLRRFGGDSSSMPPHLAPGTIIAGRYRLVRAIGAGGMGTVYAAEQMAIGRIVALKIVRPELARDPSIAERFRREARAASRIRSPHVVVVHDFGGGEDGAPLYLVMEMLDGESLDDLLQREGRLPPQRAVAIAREIGAALAAAHEAGVVHRDLKPANVFLVHGAPLKVVDFGIAGISEPEAPETGSAKITRPGELLGTPAYMSPESVARRPVGPPADLYALGVSLYEMLVGALPFEDEEPMLVLGAHLRVQPQLVRQARPGLVVPDALENLIDSLLAKHPAQRPASAAAVIQALDALDWTTARSADAAPQTGPMVVAGAAMPPRPPVTVAPLAARSRWVVLGAVTLLLACAAGIAAGGAVVTGMLDDSVAARPSRPVAAPVAAPTPAPAPAPSSVASPMPAPSLPERIRVTVSTDPRQATITWDGQPVTGGSIEVPRDGRMHHVEVVARGFESRSLQVLADRDQQLAVELRRTTRSRERTRAESSGSQPSPAPVPPPTRRTRAGTLPEW